MSKLKHPFQKKQLSLERDRRPVRPDGSPPPGRDTAERARIERNYRHEVRQALHLESTQIDEDVALVLDSKARGVPHERVERIPAMPLSDALEVKQKRRAARTGRHKGPKRPAKR